MTDKPALEPNVEFTPRKRSVAVVLNLLLPGLGEFYAGFPERGIVLAAVTLLGAIIGGWAALSPRGLIAFAVLVAAFDAAIIVDALACVRRANERRTMSPFNTRRHYAAFVVGWLALSVAISLCRTTFVVRTFRLASSSDEPMLRSHDLVLVRMSTDNLARGDLIVYKSPTASRTSYVKRLVGLPNDKLLIDAPNFVLNDQAIPVDKIGGYELATDNGGVLQFDRYEERLGTHSYQVIYDRSPAAGHEAATWDVPCDHYFVLGDNRDHSLDSRVAGPIPREAVRGKILYVYWPPSRFGVRP